jgi:hypothetical protein
MGIRIATKRRRNLQPLHEVFGLPGRRLAIDHDRLPEKAKEDEVTQSDIRAPETAIAEQRAVAIYERISTFKVTDVHSFILLGTLLKEVKHVKNTLEEETRPEIQQAHELHKNLIARTRRWSDRFTDAEALGKAKLEKFYSEQLSANVDLPKIDGISFTETWIGEVTDPDAIPREYLAPDTTRLLAVTKALKDACQIPGWKTKKVRTVSVRP